MRKPIAALAAASALLLTGCAATETPAVSTPSPSASEVSVPTRTTEAPDPTPTETVSTATLQQYGSVIAPLRADWAETVEDFDACLGEGDSVLCAIVALTANTRASLIRTEMEGARTPGYPGYVGEAPAEIERLVEDVDQAAADVQAAFPDYLAAGCPNVEGCIALSVQLGRGIDRLGAAFTAWEPYL